MPPGRTSPSAIERSSLRCVFIHEGIIIADLTAERSSDIGIPKIVQEVIEEVVILVCIATSGNKTTTRFVEYGSVKELSQSKRFTSFRVDRKRNVIHITAKEIDRSEIDYPEVILPCVT